MTCEVSSLISIPRPNFPNPVALNFCLSTKPSSQFFLVAKKPQSKEVHSPQLKHLLYLLGWSSLIFSPWYGKEPMNEWGLWFLAKIPLTQLANAVFKTTSQNLWHRRMGMLGSKDLFVGCVDVQFLFCDLHCTMGLLICDEVLGLFQCINYLLRGHNARLTAKWSEHYSLAKKWKSLLHFWLKYVFHWGTKLVISFPFHSDGES